MRRVKRKKNTPSPYALGSLQETHFASLPSLSTIQTLQVHVPGAFVGNLSPAAAQLKPPDGITGLGGSAVAVSVGAVPFAAGPESGRGSSQDAHLVLAASFPTMQTLHVHVPGAFVGILSPAAAQLKPPVGTAGLGSSGTAAGTVVVPFVAESGRGSSQETHLDLLASLVSIQVSHFQEPVAFTGGLIPAASQLKPTEAGFAPTVNTNVGRDDRSTAEAAVRSLACLKGDA